MTNTKRKQCRHASPRLLDRLVTRFGFPQELHAWEPYKKRNGITLYYCRRCECGAEQVRNAGPMGDGKWRDVDSPFRLQWEKDHFDEAEIL
jgi:hypothetical protein